MFFFFILFATNNILLSNLSNHHIFLAVILFEEMNVFECTYIVNFVLQSYTCVLYIEEYVMINGH